jgi:hypothetical protein
MMNSSADIFGENPFRSGGGGNEDLFFDATPQPQQQPMAFQQQQMGLQQQPLMHQQQMMPTSDPFAPQIAISSFPPPSGPMQTLASPQAVQQGQQSVPPSSRSWWGSCMACLTIDSYKLYFDIDADDIVTRIKGVMYHFYKPEYFRNNILGVQKTDALKGPDLYGPFWLTMTLIFFIGVSM